MASEPAMNRRMRTRMSGGVGRAGEKPALTRLAEIVIEAQDPFITELRFWNKLLLNLTKV